MLGEGQSNEDRYERGATNTNAFHLDPSRLERGFGQFLMRVCTR